MCVCLGWSAAGAHALPKVAGSRIFRSQSPLSPAVIMEFSAAERASGWHVKPGPDRGAGLRSTLAPPDLPLPVSSHPPPGLSSACARPEARPAKEHLSTRLPFAAGEAFYTVQLSGSEAGEKRDGVGVGYFSPVLNHREPVGLPFFLKNWRFFAS